MRRFSVCLVVFAALALPATAPASTIVVDTPELESPTKCGLYDAMAAAYANRDNGGCVAGDAANRIQFAPSALPKIVLTKPLPQIRSSLEIAGPGADRLTISGADQFRVFAVGSGFQRASLSIADVTIADGKKEETGAGMLVQEGSVARLTRVIVRDNEVDAAGKFAEGAGIMAFGDLTLTESTVTGNVTRNANQASNPRNEANGGGIASGGEKVKVVIDRSTVSGNTAIVIGSTERGRARGGGIFVNAQTNLVVRDSTVTGNKAEINTASGNLASGGGIAFYDGAPQGTIESSTIARNTATEGANIFTKGASPAGLRSTIVAQPLGGLNCVGPIASAGYNLEEGSSCGLASLGDQSNIDPRLATNLAANGGPTETLALLNGSPAVDRGLAGNGETTDQRGLKRPVEIPGIPNATGGDGSDIGAFEVQTPGTAIVRGPPQTKIRGLPKRTTKQRLKIRFTSSQPGSTFRCKLDKRKWRSCRSPFRTPKLALGKHVFKVKAIGPTGLVDRTPAKKRFRVVAPRRQR